MRDANACALLADGTVQCWGDNTYGQLGDGTTTSSLTPVPVSGLSNATAISVGDGFVCALISVRAHIGSLAQVIEVACWGNNADGELGNGTTTNSPTPVVVPGLNGRFGFTSVSAVSAGKSSACVLLADGAVLCWGVNGDGQLGNGTTTESLMPVPTSKLLGVPETISVGLATACAISSDGSVIECWGRNDDGELGNGTTADSSAPQSVGCNDGILHVRAYSPCCAETAPG